MARRSKTSQPSTSRRHSGATAQARARLARRKQRKKTKKSSGSIGWFGGAILVSLLGLVAVAGWLFSIARDLPDTSGLVDVERAASIAFYDRNDRLIARRGSAHGRLAQIEEMPPYLIDAVLAVEDRRFYDHPGVDIIGTGRAILANIRAGRVVQGGSTLTQQLAKNLFLTPERTIRRKVQEMMLAFWLESEFSKDEILELYLNRVYFGGGAWGVEAASLRYFGRPAREIALGEAALLAGLLKAPSRYSPSNNTNRAAARTTVVLDLMVQTGRITDRERIDAANAPIRVSRGTSSPGAQYFIDWLSERVRERAGPDHGDLIVRTTLDVEAQRAAENALANVLGDTELARGASEGALVALSHEGAVRAMVGGRSYATSQFNRAVLARRQPGSAFKAFVYASAFEAGLRPSDIREDAPVQVGDWAPQNYNDRYRGPITLREAFTRSSNSVAVRIAEETGRGHIARLAHRLGIQSTLLIDRSLALGAYEVTPLEMGTAYVPFANGGRRVDAWGIISIEEAGGDILYTSGAGMGAVVLDGRTYGQMRDLMTSVVREGTGRQAAVPGVFAGGKTGTTNDFRDAWFAGYAGDLVSVVWVGNDDNVPTDRATGGGPPARIFANFMTHAPRGSFAPSTPLIDPAIIPEMPNDTGPNNNPQSEEAVDAEEDDDPIGAFLSGLAGN
ncbi:MAG: PBP1A family penicillin-binding protein [Maricaulis sp.]|jgi:penicillin-binding protein 1A|nr:PBP1A family penicillin-binding protein [Maricaulis sp.]